MSDKVKIIETRIFSDLTGEEGMLTRREQRDPQGNILRLEEFDDEGNCAQKIERIFDEQNRLAEEKQFSLYEKPDQHIKVSYDEGGRVQQSITQYADGSLSYKNFTRDEAAKTLELKIIDEDDEVEGSEFRRFNEEGKVLEEIIYDEETLQQKTESSFDDHGRLLTRKITHEDGYILSLIFEYEIDEQGRIVEVYVDESNGKPYREEFLTYDEKGNITKHEVNDLKQGYSYHEQYEFDANNRIVKEQKVQGGTLKEETVYVYREDGILLEEQNNSGSGFVTTKYTYEFH